MIFQYSPDSGIESGLPEIRFLGESINPNRIFAYAYTLGETVEHTVVLHQWEVLASATLLVQHCP
jgi:hypothetical protein